MSVRAETRIVVLGTLLAVCSSGPFYVVPDYLSALQKAHGFSLSKLGYVSGVENSMICVSCMVTGIFLSRLGRQTMIAAALICVAGNLLTISATDYPVVLAVRALTGLFGEGPLYAMSYAVLGSAAAPDRAFGIGIGGIAVWAALVLFAETPLAALFGPAAVLVPYAIVALILAIFAGISRPHPRTDLSSENASGAVHLQAGAMLLSVVLWSAAAGAFWAFTGAAAGLLGVEEATITRALTIALTIGLGGLVIPVVMGDRLGRVLPLLIVTAGLVLSCFLFFAGHSLLQFAVALSMLQLCWDIASVYQLAGIATLDRGGRYSAFGAVAQIAGMALGPAVLGAALGQFGYGVLPLAVAGIAAAAFLMFAAAIRASKMTRSSLPALAR